MGVLTLAEKLIVAYTSMALVFSVGSANVAQLVEQRIRNAWVAGSSPAVGSIEQSQVRNLFLTCFFIAEYPCKPSKCRKNVESYLNFLPIPRFLHNEESQ